MTAEEMVAEAARLIEPEADTQDLVLLVRALLARHSTARRDLAEARALVNKLQARILEEQERALTAENMADRLLYILEGVLDIEQRGGAR